MKERGLVGGLLQGEGEAQGEVEENAEQFTLGNMESAEQGNIDADM